MIMSGIGLVVRDIRKLRKLTQAELAVRCGVSSSYVSTIEVGRQLPTLTVMEKLADGLAVPLPILSFLSLDAELIPVDKQMLFAYVRKEVEGIFLK